MNRFGQWLWWMDRDDPRFRDSHWAKLGFALIWTIGFFLLVWFSQFIVIVLGKFGSHGGVNP